MYYKDKEPIVSYVDQVALDAYYIDLYENKEMKCVSDIAKDLEMSTSTIYKYIKFCATEITKATEFKRIICSTKFSKNNEYIKIQKDYFAKRAEREKLEKRRNAIMAAKKLYEKQLARKQEDHKNVK